MSPEQLFPRPDEAFLDLLAGLPKHLDAAMPMRRQHRRELPGDIRQLSHLLTDERGDLRRDYLADPAALSAYLRYFMPWNVYRLGPLFNGLNIDLPEGATIIDLGAGPLTVPFALWMSRPHLRKRALHFVCVDRASKPMRTGLAALEDLAGGPEAFAPWRVSLVKAPLSARLRERADLIIMANALNEVLHRGEDGLEENADALAWHFAGMLAPGGEFLVVEPGIRPSVLLLAALRQGLLAHGLRPLAPCPHAGPCPMTGRGYTAWCHFNYESDDAPRWLRELSTAAHLPKENVSLSFLHFTSKAQPPAAEESGKCRVRAVSGPFALPPENPDGERRFGQYACSEHGLTLLSVPRRHMVPLPGTLIEADWPEQPEKDGKSGALILPIGHLYETPAPEQGREPAPEREPAATKPGRKNGAGSHGEAARKADHKPKIGKRSEAAPAPAARKGAGKPKRPAGASPKKPSARRHTHTQQSKKKEF